MKKKMIALTLVFYIFQVLLGLSYIQNSGLFGKSVVGRWGCVMALLAVIGIVGVLVTKGCKVKIYNTMTLIILVLHIPAVLCWAHFVGREIGGTTGINGLVVHIVHIVLGLACIFLLRRTKKET